MLVAWETQLRIFYCLSGYLYAIGTKFFVFFKLQMSSSLCTVLLSIHQEVLSTAAKIEQKNMFSLSQNLFGFIFAFQKHHEMRESL